MTKRLLLLLSLYILFSYSAFAGKEPPWGTAIQPSQEYKAQKVLFDVDYGSQEKLTNILDRVSLLNKIYGADPFDSKISIVLHGEAIPFFAIKNFDSNIELVKRAQQFSLHDTIEFKLCAAAAKARYNLEAKDFHGFITMVPMADAEIIRLQQEEGFAYMR